MSTETHTPGRATPETERVKNLSQGCTLMRALKDMTDHAEGLERQRDELLEALQASEWKPLWTAPKDREVELLHAGGETSSAVWSERPVCMLGFRAGGFPPGWTTSGAGGVDTNLPLSEVTHWREAGVAEMISAAIAKATSPNNNQAR